MPIRKELRHFYSTPEWQATRQRILARAQDRCEQCRAPNHTSVRRYKGWWVDPDKLYWRDERGAVAGYTGSVRYSQCRIVTIVLTIAHLNHTPGQDSDDNLQALCQWCHLHYDQPHHKLTRSMRKDRMRPLLQGETQCVAQRA